MIPNEVPVLNKIADRAYELLRKLDPHKPAAAPGEFHRKLYDLIWDVDRSVREGRPSANEIEACVAVAVKEFYVAPPPTPDEALAAVLAKGVK